MKIITRYQCEICKQIYNNQQSAIDCENVPVTQSKGAKIGDIVLIVSGERKGEYAKVTKIDIFPTVNWPKKYHHTEYVEGKLSDCSIRTLPFMDYEIVK